MATAIWSDKEKRWKMDAQRDAERKVFTSSKPGRAGKLECNRKFRAWQEGASDRFDWKFAKCWTMFLEQIIDRKGKTESYHQNETYGRLYLLPIFEKRKVSSIKLSEWQSAISSARPVGRVRKDGTVYRQTVALSAKTLKNLRNAIMMFTKFCTEQDIANALTGSLYIPNSAPTIGKQILQPDQLKRLFEPSSEWYAESLRFEVLTGLRPGEIYGLKMEDYQDGIITVRRSINLRNIETPGKNANAIRTIALHQLAIDQIEEQLLKSKHLESDYIFCNKIGAHGTQQAGYRAWTRIAKERNLSGSPYSLRHTFISMVKNDLPEQMVKSIVGHSVNMDTYGTYGHAVDGDMKRSAKILDLSFKKRLENKCHNSSHNTKKTKTLEA